MSPMSGEKSAGEKLHLVISEERVREVEIDDREDDGDGELYATPPPRESPQT